MSLPPSPSAISFSAQARSDFCASGHRFVRLPTFATLTPSCVLGEDYHPRLGFVEPHVRTMEHAVRRGRQGEAKRRVVDCTGSPALRWVTAANTPITPLPSNLTR